MRRDILAAAAVVLAGLFAAGCTAQPGAGGAPSPPEKPTITPPTPTATPPASPQVRWRGAVVPLPAGWHQATADDDALCLQPASSTNSDPCEDHPVEDWVQFYASERRQGPQRDTTVPFDPSSLDGTHMDGWIYRGGTQENICDESATKETVAEKGTKPVGGRDAYYVRIDVTCTEKGKRLTSQRWELPKSRIGIVAITVTPASARAVRDMVAGIDLGGYQPTKPR